MSKKQQGEQVERTLTRVEVIRILRYHGPGAVPLSGVYVAGGMTITSATLDPFSKILDRVEEEAVHGETP